MAQVFKKTIFLDGSVRRHSYPIGVKGLAKMIRDRGIGELRVYDIKTKLEYVSHAKIDTEQQAVCFTHVNAEEEEINDALRLISKA